MGDRVSYATLKGSVLKSWDGLVDYVRARVNHQPLFPRDQEGFKYALETTKYYEERFIEHRPGHIHIPRPHIVIVELQLEIMLPESEDEVIVLYGEIPLRDEDPSPTASGGTWTRLWALNHSSIGSLRESLTE